MPPPEPTPHRWRRPAAAVVVVAAAVAVGIAVGRPGRAPEPAAPDPAPAPPPLPPSPAAPLTPTDVLTSPDWEWTAPENLGPGVNTAHAERSPCLSADGLTLVFASNRPGGRGGFDLWLCRRGSPDVPFGGAVNLGPRVNTAGTEDAPSLSADGLTLAFTAVRGAGTDTDVWLARRPTPDAAWAEPVPAGPEVNTRAGEFRPWLAADGLTLTFARGDTIWAAPRPTADAPFGAARPLGSDRLIFGGPAVSADGRTLLLARHDRPAGKTRLWLARVGDPARPLDGLAPVG
ncbi:PD40 domain-containing protein, partial [bacterium]|nr:PD40 domain-containing protein [bacterium]